MGECLGVHDTVFKREKIIDTIEEKRKENEREENVEERNGEKISKKSEEKLGARYMEIDFMRITLKTNIDDNKLSVCI